MWPWNVKLKFDLRSRSRIDLNRSWCISNEAPCRDKSIGACFKSLSQFYQELDKKKRIMTSWRHHIIFTNNIWPAKARETKMVPSCLSRRGESNDISFDPQRPISTFDLRSRSGSDLICRCDLVVDASWRDKQSGACSVPLSQFYRKFQAQKQRCWPHDVIMWPRMTFLGVSGANWHRGHHY